MGTDLPIEPNSCWINQSSTWEEHFTLKGLIMGLAVGKSAACASVRLQPALIKGVRVVVLGVQSALHQMSSWVILLFNVILC